MRALYQFVEVVRAALAARLSAVSLELMDMGLRVYTPEVITPGVDQYILVNWIIRPATGEVKIVTTRVGGVFGETSPEDVAPMVAKLTAKVVEEFYPTKGGLQ